LNGLEAQAEAMKKLHIADKLSLPLEAITQKFAFLGRSGAGKTYGAGKFVEELLDAGAQVVILDPVGNWFGLRLAADGKSPGISIPIFGGDRGDIPLLHTAGALVADLVVDKAISVVLDVHHFRKHQRKEFMTQFAEQLFHRKKAARSPMHVVIEEAQVFVPQKAFKGEEQLLGAMEDLCKLGRNYGIGNTLISQRPQAVNKDVLNQIGTLFVFNMTGPQERKVMEGWIVEQGTDMTEIVKELPSLPNGTAYVWSPQWLGIFEKVKIGAKWTYDASATPVFGKTDKSGSLAPVDLERIQEAMKSTIEKAKEEDPRELRKQLAMLRKELADLQRQKPAAPAKTKTVEKPVISDAQIKRLETAVAKLAALPGEFQERMNAARAVIGELTSAAAKLQLKPFSPPARPDVKALLPPKPPVHMHAHARENASSNGAGEVGNSGLRRILMALAQYPQGRSARQVGILAGLSSKSGSFSTYLSRGRSNGWIVGGGAHLQITESGLKALGDFEPLPQGRELLEYWLNELGESGASRILRVLAEAYPQPMSKQEVADAAGLSSGSGSFSTYMSRLRSLELIQGSGELRASEELFD
jgi:hypothetical protein